MIFMTDSLFEDTFVKERKKPYQTCGVLQAAGGLACPAPLWQILDAGYPLKISPAKRFGICRIGQNHGNSTQPWRDFTSTWAKPFWPRTGSRSRGGGPHRLPTKLSQQRNNWAAKLS